VQKPLGHYSVGEAGLAVIAPLHDVLGNVGQVGLGQAGHVASMRSGKMNLTPFRAFRSEFS